MSDLKSYLNPATTFFSKEIELGHPVHTILGNTFDKYTISKKQISPPKIFWSGERYQFHRSKIVSSIPPEIINNVLAKMTQLNLSLSYWIEKSGYNYGAKMVLLSDRLEEKQIYNAFAFEESIHFHEFKNMMDFTPTKETHWHPMLNVLGDVIEDGEKSTLIYVIQVLLEGFGIGHYYNLQQDCLFTPMKEVFDRILKDEARHHGLGVVLAKESTYSMLEKDQIFEYTREIIQAFKNANWVESSIHELYPLSTKEKIQLKEETLFEQTINNRMIYIRELIGKANFLGLLERLEKEKAWTIPTP